MSRSQACAYCGALPGYECLAADGQATKPHSARSKPAKLAPVERAGVAWLRARRPELSGPVERRGPEVCDLSVDGVCFKRLCLDELWRMGSYGVGRRHASPAFVYTLAPEVVNMEFKRVFALASRRLGVQR